jgi:hypothetical protein
MINFTYNIYSRRVLLFVIAEQPLGAVAMQGGTSIAVPPLSKHLVDALRFIHPTGFIPLRFQRITRRQGGGSGDVYKQTPTEACDPGLRRGRLCQQS